MASQADGGLFGNTSGVTYGSGIFNSTTRPVTTPTSQTPLFNFSNNASGSIITSTLKSTSVNHATSPDPRKDANGFLKIGKKMITVFVGDDAESFSLHHDLITATSDFFSKALNGEFKERDGEWLYEGRFESTKETKSSYFMGLYMLGNYLQDRHFRNRVTNTLISHMITYGHYRSGMAATIYSEFPASSPWRKLIVDMWVYVSSLDWFRDQIWKYGPAEFWCEVAKQIAVNPEMRINNIGKRPWEKNPCQYHEHIEGEAKCT
ncbi:hypothetical protein FKW77_000471 [Venturia effusa]|uniref:BTB domain-containing protein n=1 Tax=Venturia effusa TaxID=50376 RepID=A0A517LA89_9PEZI|nr:hypothetical protein FKW77_000471 [Venturia effusa]